MKIKNISTSTVLANRVILCDRFKTRMQGLLGKAPLADDEACWITPCRSVHTFGMCYDLEVCFINRDKRVVRVIRRMKPWRISSVIWGAHTVIEFISRKQPRCSVGDYLEIEAGGEKLR